MFKKKLFAVIAGVALLVAVTGSAGVIGDAFGLSVVPEAHACGGTGSGGNC